METVTQTHQTDRDRWDAITERQREALELAAVPMLNKQIQDELGLRNERAVEGLFERAGRALGTSGKTATVAEFNRLKGIYGKPAYGIAHLDLPSDLPSQIDRGQRERVFEREDFSARLLSFLDGRSAIFGRLMGILAAFFMIALAFLIITSASMVLSDLFCRFGVAACQNGVSLNETNPSNARPSQGYQLALSLARNGQSRSAGDPGRIAGPNEPLLHHVRHVRI